MTSLYKHNYIAILIHVLLWMLLGFTLLLYMPLTWGFAIPYQFWIKQVTVLVILVAIYYINAEMLVPRLLLRSRSGWFILVSFCIIIASLVFIHKLELWLQLPELMEKAAEPVIHITRPHKNRPFFDAFMTMMIILVICISTSITSVTNWQRDDKKRRQLEQEKTSSELSFLKAQINPHFFFNTLNNIYALTHIDVETSRTALHKLSRLMRYLLYETQHESTALSQELAFIRDYIELMKLRLSENVIIRFDEPSLKNDPRIAPMLFLPFVENAFKHGVSSLQPASIEIRLMINGPEITFSVKNTIFKEQSTSPESSNGIGLANTKRRLNLLYPGKHDLVIHEDNFNNTFSVDLHLQTN